MASRITLVLGGIRSGKSAYAESLAKSIDGSTVYVATGLPTDAEMEARIKRHRASRPAHWTTLEVPIAVAQSLETTFSVIPPPDIVLIDSLDFWVGNLLLEHEDGDFHELEETAAAAVDDMLIALSKVRSASFLVSSEVGLSLVSTDSLGRQFQDLLGLVNQKVAAAADRVCMVVAGIPMEIKGPD